MKKVAIIGNAGGGKSTMAQQLGLKRGLPYFAVDKIQWKPGWVAVPDKEFSDKHDQLLSKPEWIIDGFGNWEAIEKRFDEADTIIYVDHPLWVHYWWATKRQFKCLFAERPDGPDGCPMLPMTLQLYKMIWNIHKTMRPKLLSIVNKYKDTKGVFHIRSPKELNVFIDTYMHID